MTSQIPLVVLTDLEPDDWATLLALCGGGYPFLICPGEGPQSKVEIAWLTQKSLDSPGGVCRIEPTPPGCEFSEKDYPLDAMEQALGDASFAEDGREVVTVFPGDLKTVLVIRPPRDLFLIWKTDPSAFGRVSAVFSGAFNLRVLLEEGVDHDELAAFVRSFKMVLYTSAFLGFDGGPNTFNPTKHPDLYDSYPDWFLRVNRIWNRHILAECMADSERELAEVSRRTGLLFEAKDVTPGLAKEVSKDFGPEVARLLDSVARMGKVIKSIEENPNQGLCADQLCAFALMGLGEAVPSTLSFDKETNHEVFSPDLTSTIGVVRFKGGVDWAAAMMVQLLAGRV